MSYLKLAKEAEARRRATTTGYEYDERHEGTPPSDLADAYRHVLRRLFALVAAGAAAPLDDCQAALQEEIRLLDDLGPERAAQLRQAEARQWWALVKACPYCGERGTFHDGDADP
jgi:uncharacterized membrane protein YccC